MHMLADNYRPVLFARALALVPALALELGVIEAMAVYPDHVRVPGGHRVRVPEGHSHRPLRDWKTIP